jgi:uncharacterized protein DUF3105
VRSPTHVTTALLLTAALVTTARPATTRQTCAMGRFFLASASGRVPSGLSMIDVEPAGVSVDVGCATTVRVARRGRFAVVRARWRACRGVRGLKLAARIAWPSCTELDGTLSARGAGSTVFVARRSACGDGHVDPASEACDGDAGCAAGERCAADCTCQPDGTATTSTTESATTSTTVTTTTLASEPDCHVERVPSEDTYHVPEGTHIVWLHNPPSSGPHYPVWATYREYAAALPRGYWVHNLEHGAILVLYRPDAPAALIAAVRTGYEAIPDDPECGHKRAILTPDPLLDVPFAAVSWTWVMECGGIVDVQSILDFTAVHRNHAPEDLCTEGAYQ